MWLVARLVAPLVAMGFAIFLIFAILEGSLINLAISGLFWIAVFLAYRVRRKLAIVKRKKLEEEMRRTLDSE